MGRIADLSAEIAAYMSSRDPQSMMEVKDDIRDLHELYANLSNGLRTLHSKAVDKWPMHMGVTGTIASLHEGTGRLVQTATDAARAFEALHEPDLGRHESPRPGEKMWNV